MDLLDFLLAGVNSNPPLFRYFENMGWRLYRIESMLCALLCFAWQRVFWSVCPVILDVQVPDAGDVEALVLVTFN